MSEVPANNSQGEEQLLELPPGFRFHPTDEELVIQYLARKALNSRYTSPVIADVDLLKWEPWHLPGKAKMGEKEWYFFCRKDRKYPTGMRTNRATASGYWKATGKDKEVFRGSGVLAGMKKTLVFHQGRAPRGKKTAWVMHEYRLEGERPPNLPAGAKDEWAVCRVFNKDLSAKPGLLQQTASTSSAPAAAGTMDSNDSLFFLDDPTELMAMPPLVDPAPFPDDLVGLKGATAGASSSGYQQQVKTQEQPAAQNAPPLQLQEDPYSYLAQPPPGEAGADGVRSLEDDLLWPDGVTDYSDMWKV